MPGSADPAVIDLVAVLKTRGQTIATAESLTAGLCAATVADVPGASAVLRGGLVVYATDLKASLAGVDEASLATDGPVASSTAGALAAGARRRCQADWGIGLTGVAGPDEQDGHPVGTVFVGISGPDCTEVAEFALTGDRRAIRCETVTRALAALRDRLDRGEGVGTGGTEPAR
ncbi:CinA family protein [Rhodococcus sp. NPDC058521]|uniref:CinA family protein n=1 Tax=Rhodococcus sp. NPDC058521 TaxID=3346536 RepID=UPI00365CFA1C